MTPDPLATGPWAEPMRAQAARAHEAKRAQRFAPLWDAIEVERRAREAAGGGPVAPQDALDGLGAGRTAPCMFCGPPAIRINGVCPGCEARSSASDFRPMVDPYAASKQRLNGNGSGSGSRGVEG